MHLIDEHYIVYEKNMLFFLRNAVCSLSREEQILGRAKTVCDSMMID
jgi:hypothetical protein